MTDSTPTQPAPGPAAGRRPAALAAGLAVLGCLGFAAFTGHMWEDYFITFRSSLNLATGHGLVFQPGERVHSFTSPLGTLLPALFALGGGENVAVRALWLFRIASALALGGAVWLVARTMARAGVTSFALAVASAALLLDPKIVDFSINGMESAWLVLFVVVSWWALADGAKLLPTAVGLAGLQWTRPDGAVFFGAIALAWLAFGAREGQAFAGRLRTLVRAVALGLLLYLPWVLVAWGYFGSPIPHTILAKVAVHAPGELAQSLLLYPWRLLFGHVALHSVFMPAYFYFGGWPAPLSWFSRGVVVVAALAWCWPAVRPGGRIASAAFFLGGFYVEYIPRSPWYYPGWETLALVAWGYVWDAWLRPAGPARSPAALVAAAGRILAALFVAVQAALLVAVAWEMRQQQSIIETGHRREIGLWLRGAAAPGDSVYLEPLGYIGYYSQLKMLDYPGLCAPEVVAARHAGYRPHAGLIAYLHPNWLVLRPDEVAEIQADKPGLLGGEYRLVRTYDARARVDAIAFLPGRSYLEFDALFLVFHRVPVKPPAA